MVHIGNSWDSLLADQFQSEYYQRLRAFLKKEYSTTTVYPPMEDIFNALRYTPYEKVKVVILGQDPYHGAGQAQGLCFSVREGVPIPPSLQNIYEELRQDIGFTPPSSGCLVPWTKQGVLLLNTVLTVRAGRPNSHKGCGWEQLTDRIIQLLNERESPMVFLLWGANARAKKVLLTNPRHLVLEAAHPSPFSASSGFFGCRHFSKTNQFLQENGIPPVDWRL